MGSKHLDQFRQLDADSDAMLGITAHAAVALPDDPEITDVHRQVVALLDELLGLLGEAPKGPLLTLVRLLRHVEPTLLKDFAKVPPDQIQLFLNELGRKLLSVGNEPAERVG